MVWPTPCHRQSRDRFTDARGYGVAGLGGALRGDRRCHAGGLQRGPGGRDGRDGGGLPAASAGVVRGSGPAHRERDDRQRQPVRLPTWRGALQAARLRHLRTRPYTPRTNGKVERFIQTLTNRWATEPSTPTQPSELEPFLVLAHRLQLQPTTRPPATRRPRLARRAGKMSWETAR